jgi:transcriptional regulator with XRE-family HTH domain
MKKTHYRDEAVIKSFGKKVRALREAKGQTIEDFANSVELHVTQLSRIELGKTNVTISYIMRLAAALEVPVTSLMDFE